MMLKLKALEPKEAEITKSIRNYLRTRRIFHWKQFQGLGAIRGISDLIGISKKIFRCPHCGNELKIGQFMAIEIKTQTGKVSDDQTVFLDIVNEEGGLAFVARSVQDVMEKLGDRRMIKE